MPGGDRTGPMQFGQMTGRAAGYCAGFGMPGYLNPVPGRGFGAGFGRGRGFRGGGRGWRHWQYAPGLPGWGRAGFGYGPLPIAPRADLSDAGAAGPAEYELEDLKRQAGYFENALEGIRKRMEQIEAAVDKQQ